MGERDPYITFLAFLLDVVVEVEAVLHSLWHNVLTQANWYSYRQYFSFRRGALILVSCRNEFPRKGTRCARIFLTCSISIPIFPRPPEAAAAAAAATAAAAAEAAELLSSSGGERLQLLLGPRTTVGGGGERLSVEGGGTGGSGDGKGFGREKSSKADSNGLYGVLPPPDTRPPTAAAGVEAMAEEETTVEGMVLMLAAVLAGHMMMTPLSSPRFVRLVRLLASARMVKVVEDCSGVRVTMVRPAFFLVSFVLLRVFKLAQLS